MIAPFRAHVPDSDLTDLRDRLHRTRWPEPATAPGWNQGVPLEYLQDLCAYWADGYDWRSCEARLNAMSQFRADIDGLGIHVIHARSPHEQAHPLIMSHGWPGSVLEFLDVIGPLTDPVAHGGDPADAFHVVCPSLPGYGFSDRPAESGWSVQRIARAWAELMAELGYERYGAYGHDWGNSITTSLGQQDVAHLSGIHVLPPIAGPDPATFDDLTEFERSSLSDLRRAAAEGSGYAEQMRTRPQTLGYGLVDSPAGLCAWIAEKFWSWTDHPGRLDDIISRDRLLDIISLYWFTQTAASSARLYWESFEQVSEWFTSGSADVVEVPAGCSIYPKEVPRPSRRWAARRYTDIRHWNELGRGGHFAAMEVPDVFVDELRTFFRIVR